MHYTRYFYIPTVTLDVDGHMLLLVASWMALCLGSKLSYDIGS